MKMLNRNNVAVERKVVAMALNNPTNVEAVHVSPECFTDNNLRRLYLAIQSEPDAFAETVWYQIARNRYHFTGTMDDIYNLKQYVVTSTLSMFSIYAKDLRKEYLRHEITACASQFSHYGADHKVYEKLMKYAMAYNDLGSNADTQGIDSSLKDLARKTEAPTPQGMDTGFSELNRCLGKGLTGSTLLTVGADTNVGKTSFSVNIADNIMQSSAKSKRPMLVDYFSEEMSNDAILDRFVSHRTGISDWNLIDPYTRLADKRTHKPAAGELRYIREQGAKLKKQGLRIYNGYNLPQIVSTIQRHASQRQPNTYLAIIDHVGIVDVPSSRNQPRYREVAQVTGAMQRLSAKYNVPIIMQSQVNRRVSMRDNNELDLDDLAESSSTSQDSTAVVLLYRKNKHKSNYENEIIAKIAKNRNGLTKKIPFSFSGSKMRFTQLDKQSAKRLMYQIKTEGDQHEQDS